MSNEAKKLENPMEIADVWLRFDDKGSNIKKRDVTPMEAIFLNASRKRHKDDTEPKVVHVHNVRTIDRTNVEEKERLLGIYGERDRNGDLIIEKVLPGAAPQAPSTFKGAKIVVDETEPATNPKKLHYPDITVQEALDDLAAAQATETLSDDIAAMKKLVEGQAAQIGQLIEMNKKLVDAVNKK